MFSATAMAASGEVRADCDAEAGDCVAVGEWDISIGIGLGGRTNPIIGNDDVPILLLPGVSYYGERFFWETDTVGFTFVETQHHMVNVIGTISYDQTYFNDWGVGNFSIEGGGGAGAGRVESNFQLSNESLPDSVLDFDPEPTGAEPTPFPTPEPTPPPESPIPEPTPDPTGLRGQGPVTDEDEGAIDLDRLHDRDISGLMGIEYSYNADRFSLGIQALQDVTSVHDGKQVRVAVSTNVDMHKSMLELTVGAEWKDSKTLDYYYGVRIDEVDDERDAHVIDDEISYYLKIDWRHRLSKKWELRGIAHYRWLGDEVHNSPIVDEEGTLAVFFGGVYHF